MRPRAAPISNPSAPAVIRQREISAESARGLQIPRSCRTPGSPAAPGDAAAGSTPSTATVTLRNGQKVEGRVIRADEFVVALALADGTSRSFRREGDVPKVEIRIPREGHLKLLSVYTDKDIHDVTAYLVTLK